jgi:hypothetical protein
MGILVRENHPENLQKYVNEDLKHYATMRG